MLLIKEMNVKIMACERSLYSKLEFILHAIPLQNKALLRIVPFILIYYKKSVFNGLFVEIKWIGQKRNFL